MVSESSSRSAVLVPRPPRRRRLGPDDSVDLLDYTDPVPLYEIGPDDGAARRRLSTTPAQDAVLRFMGS